MKLEKVDDLIDKLSENPEFKEGFDAEVAQLELAVTVMKAREEANLSQAELAERIGTSQAAISRVENGTGNPSVKTLARIAQALNQSLSISIG